MGIYLPEFEESHYLLFVTRGGEYKSNADQLSLDRNGDKKLSALFIDNILPHYCHLNNEKVIIYKKEYGKPEIVGAHNLWFNISHSNGIGALLISRKGEVGVDIEYKKGNQQILRIAKRFFHDEEVSQLEKMHLKKASQQAQQLWTLKESYIKAIGKGLAQPLNSFWFDLSQGQVNLYSGDDKEPDKEWTFYLYSYQDLYDLSLCVPEAGNVKIFHVDFKESLLSVEEIKSNTESFHRVK
jgi:4'-phosphopantetheinyl transferase